MDHPSDMIAQKEAKQPITKLVTLSEKAFYSNISKYYE
jgi:hypothetical protein